MLTVRDAVHRGSYVLIKGRKKMKYRSTYFAFFLKRPFCRKDEENTTRWKQQQKPSTFLSLSNKFQTARKGYLWLPHLYILIGLWFTCWYENLIGRQSSSRNIKSWTLVKMLQPRMLLGQIKFVPNEFNCLLQSNEN